MGALGSWSRKVGANRAKMHEEQTRSKRRKYAILATEQVGGQGQMDGGAQVVTDVIKQK